MEIFIIYSLKILYLLNTLYSMKNFILPFALTVLLTFSEISFGALRNYNAPTKCKNGSHRGVPRRIRHAPEGKYCYSAELSNCPKNPGVL